MALNAQDSIRVEDILSDPFMRENLPLNYSKSVLAHQLADPTLMGLDLNEVCEMDMEALTTQVLLAHELVTTMQASMISMMEEEERAQREAEALSESVTPLAEPTPGELLVRISFDDLFVEAHIELTEPPMGMPSPTEEDIRNALARRGVTRGIKDEYVARLAQNPVYARKFKIAQGKAPINGEDGHLEYQFEPRFDLAPKIDKNGVADYKSLEYAKNVKQGDLLCTLFPATVGEAGYSVRGEMVLGRVGKPADLVCGANTVLSDDKTRVFASCDGQVFLRGNRVMVSRVLEVENVDSATGNILFVGTVHVKGDVQSGFSVRAGGDINIDGVAENATLVAGGNLVICGGMKGQATGLMEAGGSIRVFFAENARVRAKNNIYADVLMNSRVESETSVMAFGRNGCIVGGTCTAGETVQAQRIGNESNVPTAIVVRDPDTFGKIKAGNMLKIAKYKESIVNLLASAEFAAVSKIDKLAMETMLTRAIVTKIRMERAITRLEKQNAQTKEQRDYQRYVETRESMFANVSINIDGALLKNMQLRDNCTLQKSADKVIFRSQL